MKTKTLLVLIFISQFVFSQTKNEKEERITESEFPEAAIEVIKTYLMIVNVSNSTKKLMVKNKVSK